MTDNEKKNFCTTAASAVGYMEKISCDYKSYESKTANTGRGNYTRFGRIADAMLSGRDRRIKDGFSWCAMFLLACLYESKAGHVDTTKNAGAMALNAETVDWCKEQLNVEKSYGWQYYAGVDVWVKAFKKAGMVSNTPHYGDIVVFLNRGIAYHIGLVVSVNADSVTTIEGNTSSIGNEVVSNGGCVAMKRRKVNANTIFLQL